jgi:hypothetical protein
VNHSRGTTLVPEVKNPEKQGLFISEHRGPGSGFRSSGEFADPFSAGVGSTVQSELPLVMSHSAANRRARLPPEGFPRHVRGWCVKAGEGSMKQGYRDVGYLFAPHIRRFRPARRSRIGWQRRVTMLGQLASARDSAAVHRWFQQHYSSLMQLIPQAQQAAFATGVIERLAD